MFILLCFPFYINTLINFVASLSHIRPKYYFIVLASSKLVSTIILGYLERNYYNFNASFKRVLMLVVLIVFWIVGKVGTAFYGVEKGVTS